MRRVEAAALRLEGVTRSFGTVRAVDSVSLELGHDDIVALVGPSGCGKSTLLRVIAGLVPTDAGRIELGGHVVDETGVHVAPEDRNVGFVFQDHSLFPHLTVGDNVGFGLGRRGDPGRVAEMLDLVELGELGHRYPHELSGGERQRVALARALAPAPSLVLLDEPFASLDHRLRLQLRDEVVGALRATRTPALFVTHDQAEALAVGDRVVVMRRGRIVQDADPATVFHQPNRRFVGAFMGDASFLPIDLAAGRPATSLGPLDEVAAAAAERGDGLTAMVRPDDLDFTVDPDGDATVVARTYLGSAWRVDLGLPDGTRVMALASHLDDVEVGTRGRVELVAGHRQVVVADD